jgi:hypothetical protein
MQLGTEALEYEAVRRAYHGVEEPVFYNGVQCGSVTKYSDKLLMFLLRARNPAKYREGSGADRAPGPVSINVNIIPVEERAGAPAVGDFRAITDGRILPAPEMGLSGVASSGTHTDGPPADKPTTTRRSGFFV